MEKKWFWLAVCLVPLLAWMFRWDFHIGHQADTYPRGYLIDRFTGQIWYVEGYFMYKSKPEE
jgi:hypothetical protein